MLDQLASDALLWLVQFLPLGLVITRLLSLPPNATATNIPLPYVTALHWWSAALVWFIQSTPSGIGAADGSSEGPVDTEGFNEGIYDGISEGMEEGAKEGIVDGICDIDGSNEVINEGTREGKN